MFMTISMVHDMAYVPVGKRSTVEKQFRLPVRVEIEDAPAAQFKPLLRVSDGLITRLAGDHGDVASALAANNDNPEALVRDGRVYVPVEAGRLNAPFAPGLHRSRDHDVPMLEVETRHIGGAFDDGMAREIHKDGRVDASAVAHEIASLLVNVDGKLHFQVNEPSFSFDGSSVSGIVQSHPRRHAGMLPRYRSAAVSIPVSDLDFALDLSGIPPIKGDVVCAVPSGAAWHEVKAQLRHVVAQNSHATLAERISTHAINRQIDRIASSHNVLDAVRAIMRAFSRPELREGLQGALFPLFEYHAAKIAVASDPEPLVSSDDGEVNFVTAGGQTFVELSIFNWGSHARCRIDLDRDPVCIRSPEGRYFIAAPAELNIVFMDNWITCRTPESQAREDHLVVGLPLVLCERIVPHLQGDCRDVLEAGIARMGPVTSGGVTAEFLHDEVGASLGALITLAQSTLAALPADPDISEAVLRLVDIAGFRNVDGYDLAVAFKEISASLENGDERRAEVIGRVSTAGDLALALVQARDDYIATLDPAGASLDAPGI